MAQSPLPSDPLEAHEVVLQRAAQELERRHQERRKPLPEQAEVGIVLLGRLSSERIQAEVLDLSSTGMRLAAFAHVLIQQGDRCSISIKDDALAESRWATVRWVKAHPMIQVFGVQFDA